MREFTPAESGILGVIQKGIPLCREPFAEIGQSLGMSAREVMDTIGSLEDEGIVRDISGIFNGNALGYTMSLVAFRVPDGEVERAASIISSHPGVSHNYLRDHDFNLWFTLALPPGKDMDATVARLAEGCRVTDYFIPRNERLLKIGMILPVGDEDTAAPAAVSSRVGTTGTTDIDMKTRCAVRLLQVNLPLVERPFAEIARRENGAMDGDELIAAGCDMLERGIMRRYAAVLRHRKAGYAVNAMTAWRPLSGADIDELAKPFSESPRVTHLYLRTVFPGKWEHPLFAMIHAKSEDELMDIIAGLSGRSGMRDYLVLRSLREFKKRRVHYFSTEFDTWEMKTHD